MPGLAVRVEGVVKRFGDDGAGWRRAGGRGGDGVWPAGPERRGQDDAGPDSGDAARAGCGTGGGLWPRRRRRAAAVRELIGLTGQFAAVDEMLTGRENLEMFGRLFNLSREDARRRADELLERFDLADAADRPARTYSGGMRRRLDLASSLLTRPRVLFLDEPTTGPGSAQPQRDLGDRARARARGDDAAADHPVPRGGRSAGRADRRHRPRAGDRAGHRERAQGPGRRPDPGGRAGQRRAAGPGAGGAGRGGLR